MQNGIDTKAVVQQSATGQNFENALLPQDYQLNLSDFALFLSVMKVKDAYADVLSIIKIGRAHV